MYALIHLPPDLIDAILPFLPPKSLGRFKSVSKRWYSLISSPNFIKTHTQMFNKKNPNPDPTHLILLPNVGDYSFYSLDIKQINTQTTPATVTAKRLKLQKPCYWILGSCNVLVLAYGRPRNIYLVNPTTNETLKVPGGRYNYTYGFGYDSSTDDYKVISIPFKGVQNSDPDTKFVRVYSLRNNSWKKFPNPPNQLHDYCSPHPGLLLNKNLHWIVGGGCLRITIASFSLADEEFHIIESPDFVNRVEKSWSRLFALGEKLAAVICFWLHDCGFVNELWVMEEYGVPKSWMKLCNIEYDNDQRGCEFYAKVNNQDIWVGNRDVGEICIYNTNERRYTSVTVKGCCEDFIVYGTYVESLESLERFR
ncbi:F-box/kelch-repeat protein At3g06240-like [Rutidosis leptorrhynchoides]|uniref:F-box/kelch-repeat protein At3g06240-like n=1 Tax=Rutidosis leptorrhynchoides TaxID=125765 RepID=UPI003A99B145